MYEFGHRAFFTDDESLQNSERRDYYINKSSLGIECGESVQPAAGCNTITVQVSHSLSLPKQLRMNMAMNSESPLKQAQSPSRFALNRMSKTMQGDESFAEIRRGLTESETNTLQAPHLGYLSVSAQVFPNKKILTPGSKAEPREVGTVNSYGFPIPKKDVRPTFPMKFKLSVFKKLTKPVRNSGLQNLVTSGIKVEPKDKVDDAAFHLLKPRNLTSFLSPHSPDSSARLNLKKLTSTLSSGRSQIFKLESPKHGFQEHPIKASITGLLKNDCSRRGSTASGVSKDSHMFWKLGTRSLNQLAQLGNCVGHTMEFNHHSRKDDEESARESSKKRSQPKVEKNLPLRLDTGMDLVRELDQQTTFAEFMKSRQHQLISKYQVGNKHTKFKTPISEVAGEESQSHQEIATPVTRKASKIIANMPETTDYEEFSRKNQASQDRDSESTKNTQIKHIKATRVFKNMFVQGSHSCPKFKTPASPSFNSTILGDRTRISSTGSSKRT
jgi:hypothetical protein